MITSNNKLLLEFDWKNGTWNFCSLLIYSISIDVQPFHYSDQLKYKSSLNIFVHLQSHDIATTLDFSWWKKSHNNFWAVNK